jgi:hypothetical protein
MLFDNEAIKVDLESSEIGGMWVKITAKWFNKFSSKADFFSRIAFILQISFSIVRFFDVNSNVANDSFIESKLLF